MERSKKQQGPDGDAAFGGGPLDDGHDFVLGDQAQGKDRNVRPLPLLRRIDIGNPVIHEEFVVRRFVPQILPFIGIAAEPVADEHRPPRGVAADIGNGLYRLFIPEMGHGAVGSEIDVKRFFLVAAERQAVGQIGLFEAELGQVAIASLGLGQEVVVEIDADIFLEHIRGDGLVDIVIEAGVLGGDAHQQIVAVAAAAAEIEDAQPFEIAALILDQFVQHRPQKNAGELVLPETPDIVVLAGEPAGLVVLAGTRRLVVCLDFTHI